LDFLNSAYPWIKAAHIVSVISWMAGMFYHAERAEIGSELDQTFQVMEAKLLKVIMGPAMMASWVELDQAFGCDRDDGDTCLVVT